MIPEPSTPVPQAQAKPNITIPEIEGLELHGWWLHEAISVMEELYLYYEPAEEYWIKTDFAAYQSAEAVRRELQELLDGPDLVSCLRHSAAVWRVLNRKESANIVMFCRDRSIIANLIIHMLRSRGMLEDFLKWQFTERAFEKLLHSSGVVAGASLRICDARDSDLFPARVFEAYPYFKYAVCDWKMSPAERKTVERIIGDSKISFLCQT